MSQANIRAAERDKAHGEDTRLFYGSGVYLDWPPFAWTTRLLAEHPGRPGHPDVHERGPIRTFVITV